MAPRWSPDLNYEHRTWLVYHRLCQNLQTQLFSHCFPGPGLINRKQTCPSAMCFWDRSQESRRLGRPHGPAPADSQEGRVKSRGDRAMRRPPPAVCCG